MNYGVYLASLALVLEIFVGLSWSNEGDIPCWPDCRPHAPIPIGQPNRLHYLAVNYYDFIIEAGFF